MAEPRVSPKAKTVSPEPLELAETLLAALDAADARGAGAGGPEAGCPEATAWSAGAQDPYEDLGPIGAGAMGSVTAVRDRRLGRVVAMKQMHDAHATSAAARRFLIEALVTGNLEHPGVPAVYERGVRAGKAYYTMRKASGRTLGDAIRALGSLRERLSLVPAIVNAAHTLGYAHERGVVHRDVKPDNVLLGDHGEATVLDWGIAKVSAHGGGEGLAARLDLTNDPHLTQQGAAMGTPAYMSPEQARGEVSRVGPASDVFALGACLYAVLTGQPPFRGATVAECVKAAREARFVPVLELSPTAPRALVRICEKAMAPSPSARYRTAKALAEDLEAAQSSAYFGERPRLEGAIAQAMMVVVALTLVGGSVALWTASSTLREQGTGGLLVLVLTAAGLTLTGLDARTRGALRLDRWAWTALTLTALMAVGGTSAALASTFHAAARPENLADAARYRAIVAGGVYESLGGLIVAASCLAFQVLARTLTARARRGERPSPSEADEAAPDRA